MRSSPLHRRLTRARQVWRPLTTILSLTALLIVSYQNFSIPTDRLIPEKPKRDYRVASLDPEYTHRFSQLADRSSSFDIRSFAPDKPENFEDAATHSDFSNLRAPEMNVGTMSDVGERFVESATRPMVAPIEQELVAKVNRFFRWEEIEDDEPDPYQDTKEEEKKKDPGDPGALFEELFKPQQPGGNSQGSSSFKPKQFRLSKANEVCLDFHGGSRLSYEVGQRSGVLKLNNEISQNTRLEWQVNPSEQKNSLNLDFSW
jgi:hypothetical protein